MRDAPRRPGPSIVACLNMVNFFQEFILYCGFSINAAHIVSWWLPGRDAAIHRGSAKQALGVCINQRAIYIRLLKSTKLKLSSNNSGHNHENSRLYMLLSYEKYVKTGMFACDNFFHPYYGQQISLCDTTTQSLSQRKY